MADSSSARASGGVARRLSFSAAALRATDPARSACNGRVSASTGWTTPAPWNGVGSSTVPSAVLISRAIVWSTVSCGNRARSSAATPLTSAAAKDVATCWIRQVPPFRPIDTASYVGAATSVARLARTYCLMSPAPARPSVVAFTASTEG